MNTEPRDRRPRLAALDGMRFLAAVAVMVFHYAVAWRIDGVHPPSQLLPAGSWIAVYGCLGVEVFFMISGFVICMSSWGRRLGDFFASRVSRLYPAYWVAVLLTALVAVALPLSGGIWGLVDPTPLGVAVNLTMVQEPLGVGSMDGVYWTLFVELRFYLLFVIPVMLGLTYRRVVFFCAAWMTVAVLSPVLGSTLLNALAVPEYAAYFVAGILMYLVHRFGGSPLLYAMIAFTWIVNLHAVTRRVHKLGGDYPTWPGVVIITAAYGIVLAIALGRLDRIRWRWLTTAGALTYPLYLLHQRIGYTVIRNVYLTFRPPAWLVLVATGVLMVALAWAVHRLVERPLAGYLRRSLRSSLDLMRAASVPLPLPRRGVHRPEPRTADDRLDEGDQPDKAVPQRGVRASVP
ncbi:acyltransferase family protein [Actinoplanes sp. NPDC049668]|uniref:acyltransferase family protein n=1 Tax=unclassified Actinoplanes TaxID=2626549 RepID=UPI0033B17A57